MEARWIEWIINDLKISFTLLKELVCDNKSIIYIALVLILHGRRKHVGIDK